MNTTNIDFPSRISARGITAGTVTTFAALILFMTVVAGFGIWDFNMNQIHNLGFGFWSAGFIAWILSVGIGAYVASLAGRSSTRADGLLHGITIWGSSCVIGCLSLGLFSGRLFDFATNQQGSSIFWLVFAGDLMALFVALWAADKGVRTECAIENKELEETKPMKIAS